MTCPDEVTLSVYLEECLSGEEAWRLKAHIHGCAKCTRLLQAIEDENRLLSEILAEPPAEPTLLERLSPWLGLAAAVVAARVGLNLLDEAWNETVGSRLGWLDPRGPDVAASALFGAFFFVTRQAMELLTGLLFAAAGLVVVVVIAALAIWAWRRARVSTAALAMVLPLLVAPPAQAMTQRHGETVVIAAGETIEDSLVAGGEEVRIEGLVDGDVVAIGRKIVVKGTIKGNLVSWSQKLQIDGTVEGSIFSGAQSAAMNGLARRNAFLFAQSIDLAQPARVEGDLVSFVQDLELAGQVGRDLWAGCEATSVSGSIGRNVRASCDKLALASTAKVDGDVTARVPRKDRIRIEPGASIGGKLETTLPKPKSRAKTILWSVIGLAAALVTGLFVAAVAPSVLQQRIVSAGSAARALGIGVVVLIAAPTVAILLGVTLVGLPLGVALLALFAFAAYLAKILVASAIGQWVMGGKVGLNWRYALTLLVGLLIVSFPMALPIAGAIAKALVLPLGLGLGYLAARALLVRTA